MIKGFLKDLKINEGFIAQIFSNMMNDRDLFETKEWIERYNPFIRLIVDRLLEIKGIELTKDERIEHLAQFSYAIYTKKFDVDMKDVGDFAEA